MTRIADGSRKYWQCGGGDAEDQAAVEAVINFFRDVTYNEDYLIGMDMQKGLESGAHAELVFGRNERGNQYFHEWLNWYLQDDASLPKPELKAVVT